MHSDYTLILCNLCLYFARQDGRDEKKWKENHATKVAKIPKTKRQKYGMNETNVIIYLDIRQDCNLTIFQAKIFYKKACFRVNYYFFGSNKNLDWRT